MQASEVEIYDDDAPPVSPDEKLKDTDPDKAHLSEQSKPKLSFPKLHERAVSQLYPAVTRWLANELGVSVDSLYRLGIGYLMVVPFKQGESSDAWFTIPERDTDGKVIGLGLRTRTGEKFCYPGSKHGLIFEVNPNHREGERGYSAGPHNWVRDEVCPVCEKDNCLVSSENTADPKAVICLRVKSDRPMKLGWLHILKPEGELDGAVLPPTDLPIVVVEGMSDTAAAMDLGYVAVGRPSAQASCKELIDLVRGRKVIVVGENDRKANGDWPGRDGMVRVFESLRQHCPDVKMVMPPDSIKDLRAWVVKHGLTREAFEAYIADQGKDDLPGEVLESDQIAVIGRAIIRDCFTHDSRPILRRWAESWWLWQREHGRYVAISDEQLDGYLVQWSEGKKFMEEGPKGANIKVLEPSCGSMANWKLGLKNRNNPVMLDENAHPPYWLDNKAKIGEPSDLVIVPNGVLLIPAIPEESQPLKLIQSSPALFNISSIATPYDRKAECPTWIDYLASTFADEPAKADLLQEWFGYCLVPDTRYQKFLYGVGASGSGKGTMLHVLSIVLGKSIVARTTIGDLGGRFGLETLLGKHLLTISDARQDPRRGTSLSALEKILNLTGQDDVLIDRKNKVAIANCSLTCHLLITSNVLLKLPDPEGATSRRIMILQFNQNFTATPDNFLRDRLDKEKPGILRWAVEGLVRLRSNGKFTILPSSERAKLAWAAAVNPAATFLNEWCVFGNQHRVLRDELLDAAQRWRGREDWCSSLTSIWESIREGARQIGYEVSQTHAKEKGGPAFFTGIGLTDAAARHLLGRPAGGK